LVDAFCGSSTDVEESSDCIMPMPFTRKWDDGILGILRHAEMNIATESAQKVLKPEIVKIIE
jgi:hypothetical protein